MLWPCYELVFVCYTSKYPENLCLGVAFLDKILYSECGNEIDLLYRSDVKLLYLLLSESVIFCGRILSKVVQECFGHVIIF